MTTKEEAAKHPHCFVDVTNFRGTPGRCVAWVGNAICELSEADHSEFEEVLPNGSRRVKAEYMHLYGRR